jgi:dienelactone hydrolase
VKEKVNGRNKALKIAVISVVAFILVFSIGSMAFIKIFYDQNFPRYDTVKPGYLTFSDMQGYDYTTIQFKSGKNNLTGYVFGEGSDKGLVVIAPGLGEGAHNYLAETRYFVDNGWRVFTFDYTGSFASQGNSTVGLAESKIDLEAALDYVKSNNNLKSLPVMLYGHSWGAYADTAVLNDNYNISAVASISGFNSPMGLLTEQLKAMIGPLAYLEYPFGLAYQSILFGSNANVSAVSGIDSSDTPVMIIHGNADEMISYTGASIIAQKDFITDPNVEYLTCSTPGQNDHNHLFKSKASIDYINQKNEEFKSLNAQYDGKIPQGVLDDFYANVDHFKTSELDVTFMNSINSFFESSLES